MRISRAAAILSLILAPAVASAQTPTQSTTPTTTGWIDFGVRGTSLDGDGARYERYRDMGDGLFLETVRATQDRGDWLFSFFGDHVGRRDQRLTGRFDRPGTFKSYVQWDQIPMLMSRETRSLFRTTAPGVIEIDDSIQAQVQASSSALPGLFAANATQFDTKSRRHIFETGAQYLATPELALNFRVKHTDREGVIPYGGSFGHSSLVETPAPVNHRLTDVNAGAEYQAGDWLFRGGYLASVFHNEITTLTFDSPFRLDDTSSASSRGRLSLAPSSTYFAVNGLASVKLPYRSRATAYLSVGSLKDAGDPIMPQTANTATTGLLPLDRTTVEGEARTTSYNLGFTSRPTRQVDVNLKFRSYDYDNRTPEFAMVQRVAYDNSPSTVNPAVYTEPFGVTRRSFDADFRLTPAHAVTAGVGYTHLGEDRTHRIYESTSENIFRLTFDSVGTQWLTLRTKYEHSQKRGQGLDIELLEEVGEQTGMRHFDIAPRDRDRVTMIGTIVATDMLSLNGSVAAGKDDYIQSVFGLRDNSHRVYSAGFDVVPTNNASVHASYSYEKYNALSRSRQANPGVQFDDPSRNWATDSSDRAHSFFVNAEVLHVHEKVDLQFSYDYSRARATYEYITGAVANRTLPEEVVVTTTLPTPTQLPPTLSELHRAVANMTYWATPKLGLDVSYWYERYDVEDFTLDAQANQDLVRGNVVLLGYYYLPYTANTVWGRVIYRF
ncbi:MAG: MtrB/PioB family outer membrane beta-barrel protein [Vicinamibacterales bacterium]